MKKIDLTKGNVLNVIISLALPVMGSSLLQFTYNLLDMLWVGRLGSYAVASIGSSSFYIGLGYSINALVVIGTGIKVSQAVGKHDSINIKKYINCGILINALIGIAYGIILIAMGRNFIGFLNNIALAKIVEIYGSDAIAAQKIGLQIESIIYMVIGGLHGAIASFTGQNFWCREV